MVFKFVSLIISLLAFTFNSHALTYQLINNFSELPKNGHNSALIIIDMQEIFITRAGFHKNPENIKKVQTIIDKQVEAINEAKKQGIPIVFVEYKEEGETNSVLTDLVKNYDKTTKFIKDSDGMFYSTNENELDEYLKKNKINDLIILGANGGACVEQSILGTLELKNYNVYAYSKGIADFNYEKFIYPYDDQYTSLTKEFCKSNDSNCRFKEVDELKDIIKELFIEDITILKNKPERNLSSDDNEKDSFNNRVLADMYNVKIVMPLDSLKVVKELRTVITK